MFKDSRQLDRQRTAASFEAALGRYHKEAEKWFDGSPGSIDRRLSFCDRLLHSVRTTVARLSATESHRYLAAAQELESDRRALHALRDDLLTGASDREDGTGLPGRRTANATDGLSAAPAPAGGVPGGSTDDESYSRPADAYSRTTGPAPGHQPTRPRHAPGGGMGATAGLNGVDRRWVTLESAKFVAANPDALDDTSELATRATHHASVQTSTFTPARSAAVTRAFVAAVVDLGRQAYVPTSVRTAALDVSFAAEAMYL